MITEKRPRIGSYLKGLERRIGEVEQKRSLSYQGSTPWFPNGVQIGGGSDPGGGIVINPADFGVPTNLTLSWGSFFDVIFIDASWGVPDGSGSEQIVLYEAELTKVGQGVARFVQTGGTNVRFEPVEANTQYQVRVRAIDHLGRSSAFSTAVSITTGADSTPPDKTVGLVVTSGVRSITARWTESTAVDVKNGKGYYEIQIATDSGFTLNLRTVREGGNITAFTDLVTNTTYYIRVRAIDSSGNAGAYSSTASTTTGQITSEDLSGGLGAKYTAVVNYSFEDVAAADATRAASWTYDWELIGGTPTYSLDITAANVQGGTRSLAIAVPNVSSGAAVASKSIPCSVGQTWAIQVSVKAASASTDGLIVRCYFGTVEDFTVAQATGFEFPKNLAGVNAMENENVGTSYENFFGQVVVPSGAKWMRIVLKNWLPNTATTFYFDEIYAIRAVIADFIKAGEINADHITVAGLHAGVIATGTLTATVTVSGTIQTSTGNPKVAIDSTGIRLFDSAGRITFEVAEAAGQPLLKMGRTTDPFHYLVIDAAGIRFFQDQAAGGSPFTGGTLVVDLNVNTGSASFTGAITGSTITGSTFQTDVSPKKRIEMTVTTREKINFYTGDLLETSPGSITTYIAGTGGTRRLQLALQAPNFGGVPVPVIYLISDFQSGGARGFAFFGRTSTEEAVDYIVDSGAHLQKMNKGGYIYLDNADARDMLMQTFSQGFFPGVGFVDITWTLGTAVNFHNRGFFEFFAADYGGLTMRGSESTGSTFRAVGHTSTDQSTTLRGCVFGGKP